MKVKLKLYADGVAIKLSKKRITIEKDKEINDVFTMELKNLCENIEFAKIPIAISGNKGRIRVTQLRLSRETLEHMMIAIAKVLNPDQETIHLIFNNVNHEKTIEQNPEQC